jgi:type VI secretion system protein ImpI
MILTLEVTGAQAPDMGAGHRKVFKAIGGTIGRLPDNDWVFTDPYVSGRHALIRFVGGKFFIEDTSTNGVFINSTDNRLARGQPQQLSDGDLLYIDAYKINVSIQDDAATGERSEALTVLKNAGPKLVPAPRIAPTPVPNEDRTVGLTRSGTVIDFAPDEDEDEQEDEEAEEEADDRATEWFGSSDIPEPKPASNTSLLPQRQPLQVARTPSHEPRRPPPVVKSAPPAAVPPAKSTHESQLQALFDAAGIEGLDPSTEAAQTLGGMLRVALGGIMESLRMRERMKDDLRMKATTFKAADNNPLKFSANVADAFHNLLVKRNTAYLPPVDAFEAAFHDVRDHQVALPAAMRLAFESMLSHFDPLRLQEEFDRQMKGSILGVPAKLRYWDLYRDKYGDLIKDAETGFRTLFGDAFARAYEEYLERLKPPGRSVGQ